MALVYSYPNVSRSFYGPPEQTEYEASDMYLTNVFKKSKDLLSSLELSISLEDIRLSSMDEKDNNLPKRKNGSSSKLKSILKRSASVDFISKDDVMDLKTSLPVSPLEKFEDLTLNENSNGKFQRRISFADDNNLSLVEVKNFIPSSEKINLWSQADEVFCRKFQLALSEGVEYGAAKELDFQTELELCFVEPCESNGFLQRFKHRCVSLEKCELRLRTISGIVLVKNIEYSKKVFIRYTFDQWKTNEDIEASYVPNSNDIQTDRFHFSLTLPKDKQEVEFAICYKTTSNEFWDNNYNRNYKVKSLNSSKEKH